MEAEYVKTPTTRCRYCQQVAIRRILNPGAEVKEIKLGPAFVPHLPGCPGAGVTSYERAAEHDRFQQAHIGPQGEHTPPGFMDMPIPTYNDPQSVTDEISPDPDNREELVSILRDGFKWTVRHDDIRGLVYTSPDRTTDAVFDDINDHDLAVTRYAPSPATDGPWDELWKVSMTASTPTRVMLAVAMGA